MDGEIKNRVANSKLITIDLMDYAPNVQILEVDLKQFLFNGLVLKEKDFRAAIKKFDFEKYNPDMYISEIELGVWNKK